MGLIIDSSLLIAAERRRFDMEAFIEAEAPMEAVFITSVTASELLHGVHRASPERRGIREAFVESLLRDLPILDFDLPSARRHSQLWALLEVSGNRIGVHDMMIAAICIRFGYKLATLNEGEFTRVEGLVLANARPYLRTPK
jgi:predicted nucleic acid-binding protein